MSELTPVYDRGWVMKEKVYTAGLTVDIVFIALQQVVSPNEMDQDFGII